MKRDMDLIRQILLKLEEHEHGYAPDRLKVAGCSDEQLGYHIHLMGQAGLLEVIDVTHNASTSPQTIPTRITWDGHEFLDAARSDTIWVRAKERLAGTLGSVSIDVLKSLLVVLAKDALGLSNI